MTCRFVNNVDEWGGVILWTLPSRGGMGNWVLVYLLPLREGAASLPGVAWTLWRKEWIVRRHKGAKRGQ